MTPENEDILELDTRKRIFDTIRRNPGVHMRELERMTGYSVALVKYHLGQLEKSELVTSMEEGGYLRYFIKEKELRLTMAQKRMLGVLRREIPLRIVLYLIRNPYTRHKDMHKELDLAASTLSFHLNKLVKEGIVQKDEDGVKKGFVVVDSKTVVRILVTYRPLFDKLADSFTDLWVEIYR
jgi:predicted transcriptional regulator